MKNNKKTIDNLRQIKTLIYKSKTLTSTYERKMKKLEKREQILFEKANIKTFRKTI